MIKARARFSRVKVLLCLGLVAHIGATPAANIVVNATTMTFGYRLIDLNPADDIAPSAAFVNLDPAPDITLSVTTIGVYTVIHSTPLDGNIFTQPGFFSISDPVVSIAKVGGQVSTNANLGQTQFNSIVAAHRADGKPYIHSQTAAFSGNQDIMLGAGTGIEVYATFDFQPLLDRSTLASTVGGGATGLSSLTAYSSNAISGYFTGSVDASHSQSDSLQVFKSDGFYTDGSGTSYDLNESSGSQTFLMSASNFGSSAALTTLSLSVLSGATVMLNAAVPEPSTLALQGLGLLALGMVVRRHQAKHLAVA